MRDAAWFLYRGGGAMSSNDERPMGARALAPEPGMCY